MLMTPNRRLILRRLQQGPAGTRELVQLLNSHQNDVYESLCKLMDRGVVRNIGASYRALWELTDRGRELA